MRRDVVPTRRKMERGQRKNDTLSPERSTWGVSTKGNDITQTTITITATTTWADRWASNKARSPVGVSPPGIRSVGRSVGDAKRKSGRRRGDRSITEISTFARSALRRGFSRIDCLRRKRMWIDHHAPQWRFLIRRLRRRRAFHIILCIQAVNPRVTRFHTVAAEIDGAYMIRCQTADRGVCCHDDVDDAVATAKMRRVVEKAIPAAFDDRPTAKKNPAYDVGWVCDERTSKTCVRLVQPMTAVYTAKERWWRVKFTGQASLICTASF